MLCYCVTFTKQEGPRIISATAAGCGVGLKLLAALSVVKQKFSDAESRSRLNVVPIDLSSGRVAANEKTRPRNNNNSSSSVQFSF